MIHSKSIQVLKTFSKEELKQFAEFLRSPFFNKNKNLIKLFDVLMKYHPEYEIKNEKIYSKIYPGKEYHHDNMKKLMSEMYNLSEKFLINIEIQQETFANHRYVLVQLKKRNLRNLITLNLKEIRNLIDETNCFNIDINDQYLLISSIQEFYNSEDKFTEDYFNIIPEKHQIVFGKFFENLMICVLEIKLMKFQTDYKPRDELINIFLKNSKIEDIVSKLLKSESFDDKFHYICNLLLLFLTDKEVYFYNAKKILLNNLNNLSDLNSKMILRYIQLLEYYCVFKFNENLPQEKRYEFGQINFDLMKFRLQYLEKIEMKNCQFGWLDYSAIVVKAISRNEPRWAEEFLEKFKRFVDIEMRDNVYYYSKALIEFSKKNFDEALRLTSKLKIKDFLIYKYYVHLLELKCYYELDLFDHAISKYDSVRHSITLRKPILLNDKMKGMFTKEFKFYNDLLRIKMNLNDQSNISIKKLKEEIINSNFNFNKKWYLEKIEEIEKTMSSTFQERNVNLKSNLIKSA